MQLFLKEPMRISIDPETNQFKGKKMKNNETGCKFSRRAFLGSVAAAGAAAVGSKTAIAAPMPAESEQNRRNPDDVTTNINDAMAVPRKECSMPGKFPGIVAEAYHANVFKDGKIDQDAVNEMLDQSMTMLTGKETATEAWKLLFEPKDRIGIKINPIGGKLLSNNHELVKAIIANLEAIGVPKNNIIIWDRRQESMKEIGYTEENYPGIKCLGTEYMVKEGDKEIWKGEDRLDKNTFYEFDIVGEYDEATMPYMINGGTKSYFTNILTDMVDKVINVPVLKNAGSSVTVALKNMAYGVTSNTARGHQIWSRYIAEVCAFEPVRDKTVLNIVDGLKACYEGGPGAVAHYIWQAKTIYAATDAVACDHMAFEKIFAKRVAEGITFEDARKNKDKMMEQCTRAEKLGLGVYNRDKIEHKVVKLPLPEKKQG